MSGRAANSSGQGGFNIVELMVAIAIGGLLLTGAVSLFINNRATSQVTQDLSRLQENGRFALETIVGHLRMAGHFGCANNLTRLVIHSNVSDLGSTGQLWFPASPLEGIDNYDSDDGDPQWLPTEYSDPDWSDYDLDVAPDTDAITIRYLRSRVPDYRVVDQTGRELTLNSTGGLENGQVLGIADCGAVDVIRLCHEDIADCDSSNGIDGTTITVQGNLSRAYDPDINPIAAPLVGVRFFVGTNDFGNPALFRTEYSAAGGALAESNDELFEGIADLQFLYGVDTDGDGLADTFENANSGDLNTDAVGWQNVVAVKVGVLVVTPSGRGQPLAQELPDLLDKELGTVTDNFRRRIFTTTVQIRNL